MNKNILGDQYIKWCRKNGKQGTWISGFDLYQFFNSIEMWISIKDKPLEFGTKALLHWRSGRITHETYEESHQGHVTHYLLNPLLLNTPNEKKDITVT